MLRRGQHFERVRRLPVHLPRDERRRSEVTVERLVGEQLRKQADRKGEAASCGDQNRPGNSGRAGLSLIDSDCRIGSACGPSEARSRRASASGGGAPRALKNADRVAAIQESGSDKIHRRSERQERVLLADHRHQRAGQTERDGAADGPALAHVQPDRDEQRDRERRAGVRVGRRHVHVEEQRRAEPDEDAGEEARACEPAGGADRQEDRDKPVERRTVRDRRHVGTREAIRRTAPDARHQIGNRVERAPQERAADRGEAWPPPGVGVLLEERRVKPLATADVAVEEVSILVLERHVTVEPERSQVGKILDLVGRVDARRDRWQREHERRDEHGELTSRQGQQS